MSDSLEDPLNSQSNSRNNLKYSNLPDPRRRALARAQSIISERNLDMIGRRVFPPPKKGSHSADVEETLETAADRTDLEGCSDDFSPLPRAAKPRALEEMSRKELIRKLKDTIKSSYRIADIQVAKDFSDEVVRAMSTSPPVIPEDLTWVFRDQQFATESGADAIKEFEKLINILLGPHYKLKVSELRGSKGEGPYVALEVFGANQKRLAFRFDSVIDMPG
ncbi:MAG: hypothetical protein K2X93_27720 [Candidatus Obscuribacterales bacterium]|nr:hypothetical protein [Candidatus Obscuribacterales bacterium]